MDAVLNQRFQALEAALTSLLDSVKSINPSLTATDEFLSESRGLSDDLAVLERHQRNEQRIADLRREYEEYDQKILSVVGGLAQTRKDLVDLGKTANSRGGITKDVDVNELLLFAKNISKFTVPPTKNDVPAEEEVEQELKEGGSLEKVMALKGHGTGWEQLPEHHKQWLDQFSNRPFIPWPSEKIKDGSLAQIQAMVDEGKDPSTVPVPGVIGDEKEDNSLQMDVGGMMPARPPPGHEASVDTKPDDATGRNGDGAAKTSGAAVSQPTAASSGASKSGFGGFAMYNSDEE
jgi:hypothetical protein